MNISEFCFVSASSAALVDLPLCAFSVVASTVLFFETHFCPEAHKDCKFAESTALFANNFSFLI